MNIETIQLQLSKTQSTLNCNQIQTAITFLEQNQISIEDILGIGSLGLVFKGKKSDENKTIAIKMMQINQNQDVEQIISQTQIFKQINSPNLVKIFDTLLDKDHSFFFIVMEFCSQGNLLDYANQEQLNEKQIDQFILGCLTGLQSIHDNEIIHGNLKPSNILLDDSLNPKLSDFGLVPTLKFIQINSFIPNGSLIYQSPEALEGNEEVEQDYFSMGSIICNMCGLFNSLKIQDVLKMKIGIYPNIELKELSSYLRIAFEMLNPIPGSRLNCKQTQDKIIMQQNLKKYSQYMSEQQKLVYFNQQEFSFDYPQYDVKQALDDQVIDLENGTKYYGQGLDNIPCGRGRKLYEDGSIFEGYFNIEGQENGYGRLIYEDGKIYIGECLNGLQDGKGTFLGQEVKYVGDFKSNKQHGYGIETWTNGNFYKGYFQEDKKHGKGYHSWLDGSTYEGDFFDNNIEGYGHYQWNGGRIYQGEWKNNLMQGKGIFIWNDGRKYEGEYCDDKREGYGKLFWPDGRSYEGEWKDGKQHGIGYIIGINGVPRKGFWQQGTRIQWL